MSSGSGLFVGSKGAHPHLVDKPGGIPGEIYDLRKELKTAFASLAAIAVEEFINPAASGAADLKVATATVAAEVTVTSFLAPGLAKLTALPRTLSFTTAGTTPADAPATALVTGTLNGVAQTETVTLAQTATVVESTKAWSTVASVVYPAAEGTGATVAIGVGAGMKVTSTPRSVAGAVLILKEITNGAFVTTGALNANGVYTPATAPNGTNDYGLYYDSVAAA